MGQLASFGFFFFFSRLLLLQLLLPQQLRTSLAAVW